MRTKTSAGSSSTSEPPLVPIIETIKRQAFYYFASPGNRFISFLATVTVFYGNYHLWCWMWPWLENFFQNPARMNIVLTTLIGWITHYLSQLFYLFVYRAKHPFFEQFKDNDRPWPWEYDRDFPQQFRKAIKQVAINNFIVTPLFSFVNYYFGSISNRTTFAEIPSFWVFLCQILFMQFCEDFGFYWGHRLLHHPTIYQKVHKIHHEFYDTISITALYAHPFEYVVSNLLPVGLGMILLGGKAHLLSFAVYLIFRIVSTVSGHSGYSLPFLNFNILPVSSTSAYHNYHHLKNMGNFGSSYILWDSIFGTNTQYYKDVVDQPTKGFEGYSAEAKPKVS